MTKKLRPIHENIIGLILIIIFYLTFGIEIAFGFAVLCFCFWDFSMLIVEYYLKGESR